MENTVILWWTSISRKNRNLKSYGKQGAKCNNWEENPKTREEQKKGNKTEKELQYF